MTLAPRRRWGDPPPDDPWLVRESVARADARRRPVYGRVYELFTDDPLDGEHPYAGQAKAPKTIAQRQREHMSPTEVARFPWKARIIPGPRGRRLLETVYATGDARADQAILDQVEAFWIDRLKPTYNIQRPVRRPGDPPSPRPRRQASPSRRPAPRRRHPWRVSLFLLVTVPLVLAAGLAVALLHLPWPWLPFAAAPVLGGPLGWRLTMEILRAGRRLRVWR